MFIVRFFVNLVVLALEVAAVVGTAWLGYRYPAMLAALAAVLALLLGFWLERARLKNEIGFYFGRAADKLSWIGSTVAFGEASVKSLLAGVVTLLTFSGTDTNRLFWVAVIFGVGVFAGSSLLRRLSITFGANPSRWGYFRLAAPLGLLYSAMMFTAENVKLGGKAFLPMPSLTEIARRLVLEVPARPSLAQASELLFVLKQKFDDIVVSMLAQIMSPELAKIAGILVSVNMLTGFAVAVFAVAIAEVVRRMEEAGPG